MSSTVLHVRDVVKRYATVTAVDHVSLEVESGARFALIGPNGAGKSSLIRMVLGLTRPDAGTITLSLDGRHAAPGPAFAPRIGFLPEERGLYQDVGLLRTLAYFGTLRGMTRSNAERAGREWLERLGLSDRASEPVKALSKGNQQKVQLAAALLHRPSLAILDEPFSGLDPVNQEFLLELIRDLSEQGTTVLFSAHQMQLVERLATQVAVMRSGRVVLEGTPAAIAEQWQTGDVLILQVGEGADVSALASHPAVLAATSERDTIRITVRRGESLSSLLADAARHYTIHGVRNERASLHDIYIRTVLGEPTREAEAA